MSKKSLIIVLILYIAATVASYGTYTLIMKGKSGSAAGPQQAAQEEQQTKAAVAPEGQLIAVDPNAGRTEPCPLNGKMYTTPEKDAWSKRRPLAVMIENSPDARPQSGLTSSDLVFEAMAEGGVTRFMAFFYCEAQHADVTAAPIRSARQVFVDIAQGFDRPMYVHVGGANTPGPANALGEIADLGWNTQNDMNQFSIGYPTFVRDYNRIILGDGKDLATEHTMVTTTEKLWAVAAKRGWTNMSPLLGTTVKLSAAKKTAAAGASPTTGTGQDWLTQYIPWSFQDGTANAGTTKDISFDFWNGFDAYGVHWQYDAATNGYKRFLAGQPHIDLNNKQQIEAKNAVVLFADEKGPIDENKHMLYKMTGTGDALIFQNGSVVKAKWNKPTLQSQLEFTDAAGKPVQFVRGLIWVSIVSPTTKITY